MTDSFQIPLNYVVNVSTVPAGAGLEPLQLGTILIMTDEDPVDAYDEDYMIARTATAVNNAYGTLSDTAAMATSIFSQNPNILNNYGYVIIANYIGDVIPGSPATVGTLTTKDISGNLTALQAVTDGVLNLTVNGVNQEVSGINLSECTDLADVAAAIQTKLNGVTVAEDNDKLVFTSSITGVESSITVAAKTLASGTDLYGASLLDGANAISVIGTDEVKQSHTETYAEALNRMASKIYFEGIFTTRDCSDAENIAASNWTQATQDRILFLHKSDKSALQAGSLFQQIKSNNRTRKMLYLTGDTNAQRKQNARTFATAFASRGLSTNYNGSRTTLTMTYKDLTGLNADTQISETVLNQCEQLGVDVYCCLEGLPKVISFRQGGLYFDQLANRTWLTTTVQREVANLLFTTRTKIPQTEQGIALIENTIEKVLQQGVTNGMIGAGTWNSPDTFGVLEDFHKGIRVNGYYYYHQPIADQAQSEREQRKAPLEQIAVKEAGAVEHCNILIYIEA